MMRLTQATHHTIPMKNETQIYEWTEQNDNSFFLVFYLQTPMSMNVLIIEED